MGTKVSMSTIRLSDEPKPDDRPKVLVTSDVLHRKEARLTEHQLDELARLAKKLSRRKPKGSPRITENTLIRAAVTALIAGESRLTGFTETEIADSIRP